MNLTSIIQPQQWLSSTNVMQLLSSLNDDNRESSRDEIERQKQLPCILCQALSTTLDTLLRRLWYATWLLKLNATRYISSSSSSLYVSFHSLTELNGFNTQDTSTWLVFKDLKRCFLTGCPSWRQYEQSSVNAKFAWTYCHRLKTVSSHHTSSQWPSLAANTGPNPIQTHLPSSLSMYSTNALPPRTS